MRFGTCKVSDISASELQKAEQLLSEAQRCRVFGKRIEKRRQSMAVRAFLMKALFEYYPDISLRALAAKDSGKPYFIGHEGIFVSLAHSGELVGYALSGRPVGFDVERIRPVSEKLIVRVCTKEEKEYADTHGIASFFTLWALKEAYIKAADCSFSEAKTTSFVKNGEITPPSPNITMDFGESEGYAWAVLEI